jgi:hypothetical protein
MLIGGIPVTTSFIERLMFHFSLLKSAGKIQHIRQRKSEEVFWNPKRQDAIILPHSLTAAAKSLRLHQSPASNTPHPNIPRSVHRDVGARRRRQQTRPPRHCPLETLLPVRGQVDPRGRK